MKTSKFLSLLLTVLMIASFAIPAAAADAYTLESSGDNSVRLVLTDSAFEAGVARSFTFEVPADGPYYMALSKSGEKNDFAITVSQPATDGGEAVTQTVDEMGSSAQDGYGYGYVRVGAETGAVSSVALTKGECTVSISALAATSIYYMEFRYTMPNINGSMQAIYPVDFYSYSNVASQNHVNGMIADSSNTRVEGYTYWADQNTGVTATREQDRQIHANATVAVEYKFNVTKAANYRIAMDQSFYSYKASDSTTTSDRTGYMTLSLDGTEVYKKTDTIICGANGGTTDSGDRGWRAFIAPLSEGEHTLRYYVSGLGSYIYHLTLEETAEVPEDTIVRADNNLTRIIANPTAAAIAAGTTRTYEFTVPVDGTYNFAAPHASSYAGSITVAVRNAATMEYEEIYNGTWADSENNKYAKLGTSSTAPVALQADVTYQLLLTPDADLTAAFIDVIKTEIPVNGKTAFPAYVLTASNVNVTHLNSDDCSGTAIPEGYTIVADYASEALLDTKTTGVLGNTYLDNKNCYFTYTLDVQTPGYYTLSVASGHWQSTEEMTGTVHFSLDGQEFGTDTYYATSSNKSDTLVSPSVYLTEGAHTMTIRNKGENSGCNMYVKYLMLDPAESGTGTVLAATLPAAIPGGLAATLTGEYVGNSIALDSGETVSWNVTVADGTADLRIANSTIPAGATVSCSFGDDSGEADLSATDKLLENLTLTAGTYTLTITSETDGLVLGDLTLCEHKAAVSATQARNFFDLTSGAIISGSGSLEAAAATLNSGAVYELSFNLANSGYYTVYVTARLEQSSFEAAFDGTQVTTVMYKDSTVDNVNAAKNSRVKRLATPTYLEAGAHTFTLKINEGYTGALVSGWELRRADGPVYQTASAGELVLPAWDFVSMQYIGSGWYFPHQYSQGTQMTGATGYTDVTLRNLVLINTATYTYKLSVENPGYYDLGAYLTSGTETVAINVKINDTTHIVSGDVVSGSVNKIETAEPVFLAAGTNTITVSRNSGKNTTRFNGLSFTRAEGGSMSVDTANSTAAVKAYLGDPITGKAMVAIYSGKELVNVIDVDVTNATNVEETLTYAGDAPATAKVIYVKDLETVEPLRKPIVID